MHAGPSASGNSKPTPSSRLCGRIHYPTTGVASEPEQPTGRNSRSTRLGAICTVAVTHPARFVVASAGFQDLDNIFVLALSTHECRTATIDRAGRENPLL
ncbi:C6 zinc finger domain protein [Aspergillus luchuensis]|uniref:C6 zinc finger domain protein n=1 Tax=Aspergillus kawachii TaxID=1069201 RepID=A0A146EZN1_ASPKA|nr:C6 zinc finger domain protein [Aspergillus luchuensis]